ncbi:HAMP domain-containing histidine kinase [bacterium]|nr:HAMP domain-containing histidine kinase [bacterium]MBU1884349.1 HAMP domain-containing histidine kinase [bacterium]
MINKNLNILYLCNETKKRDIPNKLSKFFEVIFIKPGGHYTVCEDTIGLIIEVDTLDQEYCEMITSNKSLTSDIGICIIAKEYKLEYLQSISILFQSILFTKDQFEDQFETSSETLTDFFLSISKNRYYNQTFRDTKNRSQVIETLRVVAHQWRQPINLISMESINLMVKASMDAKIAAKDIIESSNIISEQTQRMSNVLKSILNLGKVQRTKELFSINKMLKSIEELYKEQLAQQNISLIINYLEEDKQIYGFFTDLQEVMMNLISNASDAYVSNIEHNESKIVIDVKVTENEYNFIVKDDAGGVPEPIRERIFEPNFSTKTSERGFGIGLHVAQLIIKHEFRGTIKLQSNQNGSEFIVAIPRSDLSNIKFIY